MTDNFLDDVPWIPPTDQDRIEELQQVLKDLVRCGSFYHSAIELDSHIEDPISGEEFEKRINNLID